MVCGVVWSSNSDGVFENRKPWTAYGVDDVDNQLLRIPDRPNVIYNRNSHNGGRICDTTVKFLEGQLKNGKFGNAQPD